MQSDGQHDHVFLGASHASAERAMWATVALTLVMMALEISGGALFGSIALVADGFHMSTHAGALLIAALAYRLARARAHDARFTFGTGKFGDLAGFASALILAMVALEIGYEACARFFQPQPISFREALPIAALGLVVNLVSAWLLSRGGLDHHQGHAHAHDDARSFQLGSADCRLSIYEDGAPPRFRLEGVSAATIETDRGGGSRQTFAMRDCGAYLESIDVLPEPHAFTATVAAGRERADLRFTEGGHAHADHNMRAALVHVLADAAVSVLVIAGLALAYFFGWGFMDPLAALVGAFVIASWSYQLIQVTGAALLDMNPDLALAKRLRAAVEREGDAVADLHLWRLGPGHLGAIVSVETQSGRDTGDYRRIVADVVHLSHLTIEIRRTAPRVRTFEDAA